MFIRINAKLLQSLRGSHYPQLPSSPAPQLPSFLVRLFPLLLISEPCNFQYADVLEMICANTKLHTYGLLVRRAWRHEFSMSSPYSTSRAVVSTARPTRDPRGRRRVSRPIRRGKAHVFTG
jgi:hypothetical protein